MAKFTTHKWWLLTVALTAPVIAVAAVPNIFKAGDVISSASVNEGPNASMRRWVRVWRCGWNATTNRRPSDARAAASMAAISVG